MRDIRKVINIIAMKHAESMGFQLVNVEMAGSVSRPNVRVFIDKEGGVTLDDCERFSRSFSVRLDVEDFLRTSYVLEVSSPGLDRPLFNLQDFSNNVGKLARIVTKEPIGKESFILGRILGVQDNLICFLDKKGKNIEVPFQSISKARLEIELP